MKGIMVDNAYRALKEVMALEENHNFIVITDDDKEAIGRVFEKAAKKITSRVTFYKFSSELRPFEDIPEDLILLLKDVDMAVTLFASYEEETPFRVKLVDKILSVAKKLGHGPGITESMMIKGPMSVDFGKMIENSKALIGILSGAVLVKIKAPAGTDIELDITDRPFITDAFIENGHFGNLPPGEVACAPVETKGTGSIVCDASVGSLGKVPYPLIVKIEWGRAIAFECKDKAFGKKCQESLSADENSTMIGELGIGLNPGARITGELLEDEKALRTGHIAFGNNLDMPGGQNMSKTHIDFVFKNPTMTFVFKDNTEKTVMKNGIISVMDDVN